MAFDPDAFLQEDDLTTSTLNNSGYQNTTTSAFDPDAFLEEDEEEVGTLQGIANSAQNAFDSSKQALLAVGGVDQDQAKKISELEYSKQARKTAPGYAEYQKAEGIDAVGAFLKNPVEVTTNIIGEGLAGSLPALGAGVAAGAVGAAVGSVVPVLGTGIGYTAGQVAGTFGGSLSTEYGSKILEELQNSGMDITDPNSIQSYFSDEGKLAPIREKALLRGVPIAAFDAVSAGIGGKLGRVFGSEIIKEGEKVLGKKFATKTGEALTELGAQAVLGGGGEVAGSVAAGDEVNLKDVFAEVIGEVGTGSIEVLQGKMADRANQRKLIEAKANQDILNLSETLEQNNAPQTAQATTQELAKQLSDDLNVDREEEAVELADLSGQTLKKINEVKAETQTATTKEEVAATLSEEDLNTREQDAEKLVQQYKDAYFESQDPNDRAKAVEFQGVLDAIQVEKRKRSYEKGRSDSIQQQTVTTPTVEEAVTPTTGTEVIPLRDTIIQSGIPEEAADIYIYNLKGEGLNEDQIREIADNNKSLREEAARKNEEESIAKRDLAQRARMGDKEARAQLEGERGILATSTAKDITAVPPVAEAATLPVEQAPLTQQAVAQQVEKQPYATQEIIQPEGVRQEPQDGTQVRPTAETIISDSILSPTTSQEEGQVTPVVSDLESVASNTATPEQLTKLSQSGLVDIVKGQPVINEDGQAELTQAQAPLPKLTPTERRAEIETAPVSATAIEKPVTILETKGIPDKPGKYKTEPRQVDYNKMPVGKPFNMEGDQALSVFPDLQFAANMAESSSEEFVRATTIGKNKGNLQLPKQLDPDRILVGKKTKSKKSQPTFTNALVIKKEYGDLKIPIPSSDFSRRAIVIEDTNGEMRSIAVGNRTGAGGIIAARDIKSNPLTSNQTVPAGTAKKVYIFDTDAVYGNSITIYDIAESKSLVTEGLKTPSETIELSQPSVETPAVTEPTTAVSETITPVEPTGPQVGQRVRSGSTPQPFVITEVTPQTARDVELGEQYYKIKNERTGEESVVESVDITPIKTTRSSKKLKAVYPSKGEVEPSVLETITPAIEASAGVTPKIDMEYLAAIERSDMETAQRMVDEAAKAAGYIHQGLRHGSGARFTQFLQSFRGTAAGGISSNEAFFLTDSERTAKNYAVHAAEEGPVKQLMRKAEDAESQGDWDSYEKLIAQAEDMTYGEEGAAASAERRKNAVVYNLFVRGKFMSVDAGGKTAEEFGSLTSKINEAKRKGLDGVIFKNLDDAPNLNDPSTHYAVFATENIKSADPVTYDDAGNLIPLSQRFNKKTPDIRYARARDKAKYRQKYKSVEVLTKINNYIKNGLVEMKEAGANGDTELIEEISKKIKFASKYNINESELYSEKELEDGVRNFFKGSIPSNVIFTNDIGEDSYASYVLQTGEIEINRAYFKRNVNIDVIIGHELGHFAFGDPEFQKIFISFWDDLTQEQRDAISEYVEENYSAFSPDLRSEEKVIQAWQVLLEDNPEIRSKWQKFVELVKRFLNKYFSTSYEVNDSDKFVLNVLNAIRQDFISGKKMLREDGGDFKLQAKAQVHGQKEAGRELNSFIGGEKIVQDIVRQNYFDSTQFNDENTQKAYDLLQSLTDFTDGNNNEFAIKLNEDIQSKLKDQDVHPDIKQVIGVQILRNELQRYSNKLIVSGDPFFEKIYKLNANDIPLGIKDVTSSNIARALGAIAKINNPMIGAIQAQGKGEVVQLASTTFGTKEPSTEQINVIEEALKESGKAETIRNEDVLDSVVSAESKTGVNIRKDIDAAIKKSGVKQKTVDDVIGSTETGKTEFAGVDASTAKASIKKQATSPIDAQAERAIEGLAKLQSDVQEWPSKTQNQVRSIVQQDLRQRPDMARKEAWKSLLTSKLMNAGVSESNAMTLSDLIWKQHEINNMNREIKLIESAAENGSLGVIVEMIKNTPLQQQSTPEWRKEVIRQYLMSAGLSEKQAESAARLYDNIIAEKIAEAKQKAFEQSISKTSPWRDHMSRNGQLAKDALKKVLNAVRTSALDPTQNTESIIAKQNGWTGFSEADFRRIAEIDEILNNKDTDDLKKSEVMKELNEIISKTKLPVTVKQALAAFYTGQALMGIPTVTVNVFSPLGFSLRNLVTDIGRFALTDPTRIPLAFDTFLDSMSSWYNQTKYAFKNEVYPNDVVEYLNGNNVLKELYNKGKKEWKDGDRASGMRDMLVGMTQITGRVLSALDQGAISALENQAVNRYAMEAMSLSNIPRSKRNAVARQILQAKRNTYASLIAGGMEKERAGVLADMEMKNEIKKQLSSLNIESEKVNDVINSALNDALLSVGRNRTISMDGLSNEQKILSDDGMISYLPIKFLEQIASSSAQQGPLMQVFSKMLYGFALVPARAFHNAAWYSPYGFLRIFRDKYQKSKGMESSYSLSLGNELQYRQRLTESIAGSLVMLGLGALVKSSTDDEEDDKFKIVVTGNGPDAAADKQYYDSWIKKWKPYSIHIVMGDTVIPINIGRGGEAIFFPILIAGALDDWNIRNQMNKAKKKPADLNQATVMLGSAFLALAQRGPYAAFGKSLFNANRAGQLPEEVASQAGYFGKTFIPIVGTSLARNISDFINDPIDRSSMSGAIYSNIPIVGPMIGTKALNAFGQPIRADDWGDKLFKLGLPMVFSFPKNTPMNELNELVLSKGDGPTIPTRRNAEAKLERPMTNEEFYAYAKTYGDYVSKSMFRSRKSLERMDASRYQSQLEEYSQDASKRATRAVKRMSIE